MRDSQFSPAGALGIFAGLMFVCAIGWAGWHYRGINAGVVESKRFYPAHYETRWHQQYIGTDKDGHSHYVSVPYEVWVADRWTITIHGKNGSGVEVSSQLNVPQNEYDSLHVGEMYGVEAKRNAEFREEIDQRIKRDVQILSKRRDEDFARYRAEAESPSEPEASK